LQSAYIIFQWKAPPEPLRQLIPTPFPFVGFDDKNNLLRHKLHNIAMIANQEQENGYYQVQSGFFQVMDLLLCSCPMKENIRVIAPTVSDNRSSLIMKTQSYLREHLSEFVTLDVLARNASVSPSTLSHQYKAGTGESPMKTLVQMRIQLTKNLLLKGSPLKYIAGQAGFCDEYHLSKTFKKVTGQSPKEYIRTI
jgi:YesN/AraC family two-component response regulator